MEESMQEDRYLFVLLGLDTLYSINLNDLKNCNLETVFSHLTPHKQPDGSSYPLGMGLFVTHGDHGGSKLHFFGGENLEDRSINVKDRSIDLDLAYIGEYLNKRPKRPMQLSLYQIQSLYQNKTTIKETPEVANWLNKKVFSFTPVVLKDKQQLIITPDHVESGTSTDQLIPDHYGYKVRPIVVNMLEKVYVLTTRPLSTMFPTWNGVFGKQILFEVFDPKKGNWRRLPNPPAPLYMDILGYGEVGDLLLRFHCVYKSKLLVETRFATKIGHYLFDAIAEKWKIVENHLYPTILACLEYKNFLLALVESRFISYELVAYDLETFGEEDFSTYYMPILAIEKENSESAIYEASLSIVENNRICLVYNIFPKLHVYLFDVIIEPYMVKAERMVQREFDLPQVLFVDGNILSAFVFPKLENDVEGSNQGCDIGEPNFVVVKNLPFTITTSDIRQEFQRLKFGEIKPNGIILNCKEHLAYVEFEDVQSLNKAIKASPINFAGKTVYIEKKEAVAVAEVSKMDDSEELDPLKISSA